MENTASGHGVLAYFVTYVIHVLLVTSSSKALHNNTR